ncbi:hypothetical protein A2U01_0039389, partial [Trifolium medium]|nr:hypothetical protein [Trifolium medium]
YLRWWKASSTEGKGTCKNVSTTTLKYELSELRVSRVLIRMRIYRQSSCMDMHEEWQFHNMSGVENSTLQERIVLAVVESFMHGGERYLQNSNAQV